MSAGAGVERENTTSPDGERPAAPLDADERDDLVEVAALGGLEEGALVDELELPRHDGVLAREALGERAEDAAGVAVGQPRRRLRPARALVARVEVRAEVGPGRAGRRRHRVGGEPDDRPVGLDREVRPLAEAEERDAGEPVHPDGARLEAGAEPERCVLRQEDELLADDAAGERADEVVDEDAVRLGREAHALTAQRERHDEVERVRPRSISSTSSSIRTWSRGGSCGA